MSHATRLTWHLLILSAIMIFAMPILATSGFTPAVNMLGFASGMNNGDTIEWIVTFSNTGDSTGQNIVLSNTVGDGLQVESVQFNAGTSSVNGRTITVSLPSIDAENTVQYTILTTIINANADLSNITCVTASNLSGETCARGLAVQALPDTGEPPIWRHPSLWLGVMTISVSLLLIGLGLLGYRALGIEDEFEIA